MSNQSVIDSLSDKARILLKELTESGADGILVADMLHQEGDSAKYCLYELRDKKLIKPSAKNQDLFPIAYTASALGRDLYASWEKRRSEVDKEKKRQKRWEFWKLLIAAFLGAAFREIFAAIPSFISFIQQWFSNAVP